ATYYSDEFAVVDDSGLVHPFARPLGIREDFFPAQTNYTAENLGASTGVKPLPLGTAVLCSYEAGARWQPALLSQGQGALELLANSVAVRCQPHQTLRRLQKLVEHAVFFKWTNPSCSWPWTNWETRIYWWNVKRRPNIPHAASPSDAWA